MGDLSPELNLALAIDNDDTADYLTTSEGLRGSLLVLDGLFNSGTGHAHNGSHQGGTLEFLDLTVGEDLTVTGASDLHGPVHAYSNLIANGATTLSSTLSTGGLATLNSLDVTTTSRFRGVVTFDAAINAATLAVTGAITASGDITGRYLHSSDGSNGVVIADVGNLYLRSQSTLATIVDQGHLRVTAGTIAAGTPLSGTGGDISANRGGNAGYVFLGNASHYVGFDSANYQMPNGNLYTNGSLVANEANAATLSNKTLVDPKLTSQAVIGGASYTLPTVVGNAGMWRYLKAWSQNMTINLTNGTFILGTTQYTSGQYILLNGDSVSVYCDGSNFWVL